MGSPYSDATRSQSEPGVDTPPSKGSGAHYALVVGAKTYAAYVPMGTTIDVDREPEAPTYLPTMPAWSRGLVSAHGVAVLLVDLHRLLSTTPPIMTRSRGGVDDRVYVHVAHNGTAFALLVDRALGFRVLPLEARATAQYAAENEGVASAVPANDGFYRLNLDALWSRLLQDLGVEETDETTG